MRKTNLIKFMQISLVSSFAIISIGCGKVSTLSNLPEGGARVEEMPEMKVINSKVDTMDLQTQNVVQQISALGLQNPLSLFGGGLSGSVKQFSGLSKDLQIKIDELKLKLNSQIAQLDASNPQHQQMIAQLQNALTHLDQVSARITEVIAKIEVKINEVFAKLQQKLSGLSGIQGIIAQMVLGQLKNSVLKNLI